VRNQPALREGGRARWLVPGAILGAVAIGMLVVTMQRQAGESLVGIVIVAALYAAMLVCAWAVRSRRARNLTLAWLMLGMAIAALGVLLIVLVTERSGP